MSCPECGSRNIETELDSAQSYCGVCGVVISSAQIVSAVSFEDNRGRPNVVGVFVNTETGRAGSLGQNYQRPSREQTLVKANRRIRQVAAALKLQTHHMEKANRIFKLALQHRFTNGRRRDAVVSACLYIVCRRESTPHMLIDFADILHINVHALGHTFLQLCFVLDIQPPVMDPSLYIDRFVAKLEFGEKVHVVAQTALRFVQRMRRDWIQTGRRPSGICGAAIIMAARVHGFNRTFQDVIPVVRIGTGALRRRLREFENTASSHLTPNQFTTMDLEEEANPPSYTRHLVKKTDAATPVTTVPHFNSGEDSPDEESDNEGNEEGTTKGVAEEIRKYLGEMEEESEKKQGKNKKDQVSDMSLKEKENENVSEEDSENLSDIDDEEIDCYIVTSESERKKRSALWHNLNRDYLKKKEEKEKQFQELVDTGKVNPRRSRKRNRVETQNTAGEAAEQAFAKKAKSSRINWKVFEMSGLFDDAHNASETATALPDVTGNSSSSSNVVSSALQDQSSHTGTATQSLSSRKNKNRSTRGGKKQDLTSSSNVRKRSQRLRSKRLQKLSRDEAAKEDTFEDTLGIL